MNDELSEKIKDIDIDAVLIAQINKGASLDMNKVDRADFKPSLQIINKADGLLEVVNRRTRDSKTFQIAENKYQAIFSKSDIHFLDTDTGKLEEVNLLVREVLGKLIMTNANYKISIFTDKVGYRLKMLNGTGFTITLIRIGDSFTDFTNITSKAEGSQVFWDNFHPDVSMRLLLKVGGPELYTTIKHQTSPRKFVWRIVHTGNFNFTSFGADANEDKTELITNVDIIDNNTFTYTEEWTGRVARITNKKTRVKQYFDNPVYPVIIDPTVDLAVGANADDGWAKITFTWLTNSIFCGWTTTSAFDYPGIRFSSVAIAAGVTVTSATFSLTTRAGSYLPGNVTAKVWADNADNPPAFSASSWPSNITKTTNSTNFTPSGTTDAVNNIDVTSQVTQVLGRAGWASGNAMRFAILTPTGAGKDAYGRFYDYSTNTAKAATLSITYTTGGGSFIARPNPRPNQAINRASTF